MADMNNKPTTLFWIIGIIAMLWNVMGVGAYLGQAYMSEEAIALLPEAEQAYYNGVPAWVTAAFAISVFAGFIGCITLLLKKKISSKIFLISLIAVILQFIYNFFIQDFMDISGVGRMALPIMVIIIAAFLLWYSTNCTKKGILK